MKKISKRKKALAKYLNLDIDDIVLDQDEELLRHGELCYYVLDKEELDEKEFETFSSCYFPAIHDNLLIGLALVLQQESKHIPNIRQLHITDLDYTTSTYVKETTDNWFKKLIDQDERIMYEKLGFLDEAIKNDWGKVGKFYIRPL